MHVTISHNLVEARVELKLNVTHHAQNLRGQTSEILSRRRMRPGSPESTRDKQACARATNLNKISPRQSIAGIHAIRGPAFDGTREPYLTRFTS